MGSPPREEDALDGGLAAATGLVGPKVDAVFQLEETSHSVGIHVVGDRGTPQPDGLLQNLAERKPEPFKFGFAKATGVAARPDTGMKEAFVGVDVTHTGKQALIEQGSLDRQASATKECGKFFRGDGEWLCACCGKGRLPVQTQKLEPAKAARVNKAQLATTGQAEPSVSMCGDWSFGGRDKKPPGHAEMDDPLSLRRNPR